MSQVVSFIQALSQHLGQSLSTSDDSQTHTLTIDGEELFLRYLPEDDLWVYFGFVTDFMSEVSPEQLTKALELNLFGRGTADYYLGLIGKALALSGRLPMADATPEGLIEQLVQLAQHLTPLHQTLTSTESASVPADDMPEQTFEAPASHWDQSFIQV